MRLPWVSRALHDETMAIYKGWLDAAREENMRTQRYYMDLLGKYHQLQLSNGGNDSNAGPVARGTSGGTSAAKGSTEADPVLMAIAARAGSDGRKRAMMLAQMRRDRADHKSDIEILRAIEEGVTVEGMP